VVCGCILLIERRGDPRLLVIEKRSHGEKKREKKLHTRATQEGETDSMDEWAIERDRQLQQAKGVDTLS